MIPTVILIFIAVLVFHWFRCRVKRRHCNRIADGIRDMRNGQGNPKLRLHGLDQGMREICTQVNGLAEQLQEYATRIERMEAMQKQMTSNLLHDVQTPLAVMLGYIEALQTDDSLTEADKQRYLGIVRDRGSKLSRLFRDFFELAKLESNDKSFALVQVNLPDKVEEAAASFEMDCDKLNLTLQVELPFQSIYVWAYAPFVERILTNLISNAIRYGQEGGVVGIKLHSDESYVWVDIWDRGPGIDAGDMPHLFDRLYTSERSRNAKLQGTGLGLAIVKQLIEKQQGMIRVSSVPSECTKFSFGLRRVFIP